MIAIDNQRCTGCGTCARVCPHRVIELSGAPGARVAILAAEDRCIECGACQTNCHESALSVTQGTGCLFAIAAEEWLKRQDTDPTGARSGTDPAQPGCG